MTTIFISYSHQDETPWKDFVVSHLRVAERQGVFDVWDDRRIKGGSDWQAEISTALAQADIGILLVSRHFLTSDFILDHEVQTMLQRHACEDLALYPILISDCTWQTVDWLRAMNIRPKDGTPLNSFPEAERDQVMTDMASEIGQMLHSDREVEARCKRRTRSQRRQSEAKGGRLSWWRSAGTATRAGVLGTVLAGLALISSIVAAIFLSGTDCTIVANQSLAACDDVEIGGDVRLGDGQ